MDSMDGWMDIWLSITVQVGNSLRKWRLSSPTCKLYKVNCIEGDLATFLRIHIMIWDQSQILVMMTAMDWTFVSPPNLRIDTLNYSVMVFRGGPLGDDEVLKEGPLWWDKCPHKKRWEIVCIPSLLCKDTVRRGPSAKQEGGSHQTLTTWVLWFGCKKKPILTPCGKEFFDLLSIAFVIMKWKVLSHVQLCNPMDYTVHGIL